ncbi:MAG: UDP-3-O-(3-hydroxymyristoyl)glucosamine N-acyltransferase, partial [Spirochaetes bacterium]|nr:UDP-3-O-(3-hydroxymyristoyl)glucosamine N-acyltransferase [Spirochaetota bacterium]
MHKKMEITTGELAEKLKAELEGEKDFIVTGVSEPETATQNNIIFLGSKKYLDKVAGSKGRVVLTGKDFKIEGKIHLYVQDAEMAFIHLLQIFEREKTLQDQEIHPSACVHPSAKIGAHSKIMEFVSIRPHARIGRNCLIYPHVTIGESVIIGDNTVIYPQVTIYDGSVIGAHVIIHSGVVIGSDGFGYIQREGKNIKIPQIGNVIIEDNVEIGSNTTIDRSTIGSTIIRRGSKIDNLVQIAHNVMIGENTIIAGQSGVSGSSVIGKNCILAGQVGIADHVIMEDNIIVGAKTGVPSRVVRSEEKMIFGIPAKPIIKAKRIEACISRLPELF